MPRFTEQEKEIINRKLLIEGEKLFAAHGLKKVTAVSYTHLDVYKRQS